MAAPSVSHFRDGIDPEEVWDFSQDLSATPASLSRKREFRWTLRDGQAVSEAQQGRGSLLSDSMRRNATSFRRQLGKSLWKGLHGMSERWPCRRCQPWLVVWMQGLHDAVNVRLGKPPFHPEAFERFSSGALGRGFHRGCFACRVARWGSRLVAQTPRQPGASR